MGALDVITRGVDSSGRTVRGTRQNFQFYDRLNAGPAQGRLVIVQGSFSYAAASAGTHALAMCMDYRTWNLSAAIRGAVVKQGRDWMGTMYYRTEADGFDPHIHNNLIGDRPASESALTQVRDYRLGLNGLANRREDRNPYRPRHIHDYNYLEGDEMEFEKQDRDRLIHIEEMLAREQDRDSRDKDRDRRRFRRLTTVLGNQADQLTLLINSCQEDTTKRQLKKMQEDILLQLKNDPDVDGVDDPSDDALAEKNMG